MNRIKAIAELCNLSVSTVSRALNGYPDVSEKTRAKVLAVARENGYLPSAAARALKMKNTRNLGILYTGQLRHEYYPSIIDAFRKEAEKQSYDVTYISDRMSLQKQRMSYLEHCRFRGFDGIAIMSVDFQEPQVLELVASDIPLISIDHAYDGHVCIASDNMQGMRTLVEHALSHGHRRLAFIHGHAATVTEQRVVSFYRTLEAHSVSTPSEYMHSVTYGDSAATYQATQALLALPTPPTCIFFCDDYAALGGMEAIRATGLRIPQDISVAGYDGGLIAALTMPALCTYRQDGKGIGRQLARTLIQLIRKPEEVAATPRIQVTGQLMAGESIGPVPAEAR